MRAAMARTIDPARHAARRAQILAGAATAFAEKGFDRATVKDICAAASVGSGTLFHYFTDKRAIFHALLEADRDEVIRDLAAVETVDPLVAFWRVIDRMTVDLRDPMAGPIMFAILGQLTVDPKVGQLLEGTDAAYHSALTELISRLQSDGRADPDWPASQAATWLQSITDGVYLRCGDEGFDPDAEIRRLRIVLSRVLALPASADQ